MLKLCLPLWPSPHPQHPKATVTSSTSATARFVASRAPAGPISIRRKSSSWGPRRDIAGKIRKTRLLKFHFCANCGSTTHFTFDR